MLLRLVIVFRILVLVMGYCDNYSGLCASNCTEYICRGKCYPREHRCVSRELDPCFHNCGLQERDQRFEIEMGLYKYSYTKISKYTGIQNNPRQIGNSNSKSNDETQNFFTNFFKKSIHHYFVLYKGFAYDFSPDGIGIRDINYFFYEYEYHDKSSDTGVCLIYKLNGSSNCSVAQVHAYVLKYNHSSYNLIQDNCQDFANNLIATLLADCVQPVLFNNSHTVPYPSVDNCPEGTDIHAILGIVVGSIMTILVVSIVALLILIKKKYRCIIRCISRCKDYIKNTAGSVAVSPERTPLLN